jgi:aspartyl aminopeptidase
MLRTALAVSIAAALLVGAGPASADTPVGHAPTAWESERFARHRAAAMRFGDAYREFLSANKTEREVVRAAIAMARAQGFRELYTGAEAPPARGLRPGARVYAVAHGKIAAFAVIGSAPLSEGVNVVATHVDAVRIDLKQNPLYADGNLALLETHYYGGIKNYQWLSLPLELRGVVIKQDGTAVEISIGADPRDPVLVIPDVAVHVAHHVDRIEGEEVPAESLDPILASTPAARAAAGADPFAAEAARLLRERYGIEPGDLASAELQLVPAGPARDVGIDRALVGGYGQDDRACTYAAMRALLEVGTPRRTAIVVLADKEEIGSTGNTGARSRFFRRFVAELLEATGGAPTELALDRILAASLVFSADVSGAVNPAYAELYDRKNSSFLGSGVIWNTAAHAEVMARVRSLFERHQIVHQPTTWGKARGSKRESGTVLEFFTAQGMNGLEVAIPLLSMHAPFEVISKADLYEAYRAYRALLADQEGAR